MPGTKRKSRLYMGPYHRDNRASMKKRFPILVFILVLAGLALSCATDSPSNRTDKSPASLQVPQPVPASSEPKLVLSSQQADPRGKVSEISDARRTPLPFSIILMNLPEPPSPALSLAPQKLAEKALAPVQLPLSAEKPEYLDMPALVSRPAKLVGATSLAEPMPPAPKVAKKTSSVPAAPGAAAHAAASSSSGGQASVAKIPAEAKAQAKESSAPTKPQASPQADKEAAKEGPKAGQEIPAAPTSSAPAVLPESLRQPDISRRVSVEAGSRVELPFSGTGWTYLGERDGKGGILYESRRYEDSGLVFVLLASKTGDYVLRFQRQDLLRGTTNEELVAVSVSPRVQVQPQQAAAASPSPASDPGTSGTAAAALPQATTPASSAPPASASPSVGSNPAVLAAAQSLSLPETPEGLILTARNELAANRVAGAIAALDRFLVLYPSGMDEVFYLYGMALEQNGPLKDSKRAFSFYKKVRDEYPQSEFWDKADERASYIERHYFEIR